MLAAAPRRPAKAAAASLPRLEIGKHPGNRSRAWIASSPQVENEARIADHLASKSGRSYIAPAEIFFHFSQQMHVSFLIVARLGNSSFPMQFLLVWRLCSFQTHRPI